MTATPPTVPVVDRPAPVLLGDRLAALRRELSSGAIPLALVLGLGVVFLVAGLRPTTVTFSDEGQAYSAECGIETVLIGSTWEALDAACATSSGLRVLATAGGALLLVGGLGQVAWLAARRAPASSPLRTVVATMPSRLALVGAACAAAVAVGASIVARARLDAAALSGACAAGECPDRAGLAGAVRLGALVVLVVLVAVAAWPALRRRSPVWRGGALLLAAGSLLVLLAARPVTVTADGDLRGTCGVEVLLAGHPQRSVTAACRDAMGGRPVLGIAGLVVAAAGALAVRAGQTSPPTEERPAPGPQPSSGDGRRRVRRTRPLVAGEVER